MELIKGETDYSKELKDTLNKDEYYNNLIIREEALCTYLNATFDKKENCSLLEEFVKGSKRMKDIELKAKLKTLDEYANKITKMTKEEYDEKFDERNNELLMKNYEYRNHIHKRSVIYKIIIQDNKYKYCINKIEEIETEIACIELETIVKLYYSIELHK